MSPARPDEHQLGEAEKAPGTGPEGGEVTGGDSAPLPQASGPASSAQRADSLLNTSVSDLMLFVRILYVPLTCIGVLLFLVAFSVGIWALGWYLPLSADDHWAIVCTYVAGVAGSLLCFSRICAARYWKWLLSTAVLLAVLGVTIGVVLKYTALPYSQKIRLAVALGTKVPCVYLELAMWFAILGGSEEDGVGALMLLFMIEVSTTAGVIATSGVTAHVWARYGYLFALLYLCLVHYATYHEGRLPEAGESEDCEIDMDFGGGC